MNPDSLDRFIVAQENTYSEALAEIRQYRKDGHWMWFIFPQLKGLGTSETAEYYGITDLAEAKAYLKHDILGSRLREITEALLCSDIECLNEIFSYVDELKLFSCMTLFHQADPSEDLFMQVLKRFYHGEQDANTLHMLDVEV